MLRLLSLLTVFMLVVLPSASFAGSDIVSSAPAKEEVIDHGQSTTPTFVDPYSRQGSSKTVTSNGAATIASIGICSDAGVSCSGLVVGAAAADIECSSSGSWEVSEVSGVCWRNLDVCYGAGTPSEVCVSLSGDTATASDVSIIEDKTQCSGGNLNAGKNFCLHNDSGSIGVTGDTGDDMFAIEANAGVYFEYRNLPSADADRLIWVERNSTDPRSIMMPSGPVGSFSDYKGFVAAAPSAAGLSVEHGCYPISTLSMCGQPTITTPIAGACGNASRVADGFYAVLADIAVGDFCDIGIAASQAETATNISWTCSGHNGGATTSCNKGKAINGSCSATLDTCVAGNFSDTADTATDYLWNCTGIAGGTTASCSKARSSSLVTEAEALSICPNVNTGYGHGGGCIFGSYDQGINSIGGKYYCEIDEEESDDCLDRLDRHVEYFEIVKDIDTGVVSQFLVYSYEIRSTGTTIHFEEEWGTKPY